MSDRDRQLEQLGVALREDAPRPDPAFAGELDRRVREGFARPPRFRLPRLPRRALVAAAGAAAALLLAVAAGVGLLGGSGGDSHTTSDLAAQPTTQQEALRAAPVPAAASGVPTAARRVERTAEMTVAAPGGELQRVADGIGRVAEGHRGFVVSSHISTGDESTRGGNFVLRVPTTEMESAMGEIGKLGHVRARSESSQDMTTSYRRVQDRLGDLLLERRATADRLRDASGAEADRLRARLRRLSATVDHLSGRMHDLRRRTVYSTVDVSLEQEQGGGATGHSGPGGALHDALRTLGGALELAIRALGVIVPLALLGLLAWLAGGALRRRRREAALF